VTRARSEARGGGGALPLVTALSGGLRPLSPRPRRAGRDEPGRVPDRAGQWRRRPGGPARRGLSSCKTDRLRRLTPPRSGPPGGCDVGTRGTKARPRSRPADGETIRLEGGALPGAVLSEGDGSGRAGYARRSTRGLAPSSGPWSGRFTTLSPAHDSIRAGPAHDSSSEAMSASRAIVLMLRAVPVLAAGILSLDRAIPSP
jgi:hypothetical protein